MLIHIKNKTVNVSMSTVAIPNFDVKVWTRKSDLPQVNLLRSLTQPLITRRRTLELTDIDYDIIQDEISGMEYFEQNTSIRRNVMNDDDIEDFEMF